MKNNKAPNNRIYTFFCKKIIKMSLNKIKENHKKFSKTQEAMKKLRIAAQNAVIQSKSIKNVIEQLQEIAEPLGYKIDEDTGKLNAL